MDDERLNRVRAAMHQQRLDALVCRLPANVLMLSGHWPLIGWSFLLFPLEGKPTCVVPHCDEREARQELWEADCVSFLFGVLDAGSPYEDIAKALKEASAGKALHRVGFEGSFEAVAPPWNAAEPAIPAAPTRQLLDDVFGKAALVDATDMLNGLRGRKTPAEQHRLRIVNEIATFGLAAFEEKVDVGVTGVELVSHVEQTIMLKGTGHKGAQRVRAFAQASTGPHETVVAFRPMEITTARKLQDDELALLELAVVADGFWSDRTRVKVAGTPSSQKAEIFDLVAEAQESAIAVVKAGVTAGQVDQAARSKIRAAGYEREFLHVTGHGLGLRYHEPVPLICPGSSEVLEEGMVHTVEPGIYLCGMGGIRVEDNVLVTEIGGEVLGPFRKEL